MTEDELKAIEALVAQARQCAQNGQAKNAYAIFQAIGREHSLALIAALREAWEEIEIMSRERKAMDESWAEKEVELERLRAETALGHKAIEAAHARGRLFERDHSHD